MSYPAGKVRRLTRNSRASHSLYAVAITQCAVDVLENRAISFYQSLR